MAVLDALGTYLQTGGLGTLGTSIMLSRLPDDPDVCICLFEFDGLGPVLTKGSAPLAVSRPRIRAVCRAARMDYPAARSSAVQVQNLLGAIQDTTLSGVNFAGVQLTSDIYPLRYDNDDRPMMAVDLVAWVRP